MGRDNGTSEGELAVGSGREGRRWRRKLERKAERLLRRAPDRRPGEGGEEYAERLRPWFLGRTGTTTDSGELWNVVVRLIAEGEAETTVAATEPWEALARRFLRREGGSLHITDPAVELLARYGYDVNVSIYRHFRGVGSEGGVRSYWRIGESSGEERVGVMYAPDRDAVVVWRWGEYKNDPSIAVLEEMDVDATDEGERAAGHPTEEEFAEHVGEKYLSMIVAAGIEPTLQAAAVMRGEDVDPAALRDRYEQLIRERGAGYLIVWDAYNGEFELCGYRYEDDDRLRVWLREEFGMADEPRPLHHDGELGQLGGEA